MRLIALTALVACNPHTVGGGNDADDTAGRPPCHDCADTDTDADADADSDTDADADTDTDADTEYQFVQTFTAPGGSVYGSMFCHIEYIESGTLDDRLEDGDWAGWEYSRTGHWVSSVTIASNPGLIDGARSNCTVCPDELAEEPYGTEGEALGCTWTGYGQDAGEARINGSVSTVYFDESFSATTVNLEGGTSVLVDLR